MILLQIPGVGKGSSPVDQHRFNALFYKIFLFTGRQIGIGDYGIHAVQRAGDAHAVDTEFFGMGYQYGLSGVADDVLVESGHLEAVI